MRAETRKYNVAYLTSNDTTLIGRLKFFTALGRFTDDYKSVMLFIYIIYNNIHIILTLP